MDDNVFYQLSKFLWALAAPANLLVLWLALGGALLIWGQKSLSYRVGRFMLGSGLFVLLLIMVVPAGYWGIALLEDRIPRPKQLPADVAGIIVLGGSESENVASTRGAVYTNYGTMNRLLMFKLLAEQYPQAKLMYAGGTTRVYTHPHMRQADIAQKVLTIMLGPQREVLYERESRTTYENALNAAKIVGDKRKQSWILVTSAFHMPRALATFRQQGWNVTPMPTDYMTEAMFKPLWQVDFMRNLATLQTFLREIIGMVGYYAGGKSDQLFPGPR